MKFDEPLSRQIEAARSSGSEIPVIITMQRNEDLEALKSAGVKVRMAYQSMPAVAATLSAAQLEQVAKMPQVKTIELDSEAHSQKQKP